MRPHIITHTRTHSYTQTYTRTHTHTHCSCSPRSWHDGPWTYKFSPLQRTNSPGQCTVPVPLCSQVTDKYTTSIAIYQSLIFQRQHQIIHKKKNRARTNKPNGLWTFSLRIRNRVYCVPRRGGTYAQPTTDRLELPMRTELNRHHRHTHCWSSARPARSVTDSQHPHTNALELSCAHTALRRHKRERRIRREPPRAHIHSRRVMLSVCVATTPTSPTIEHNILRGIVHLCHGVGSILCMELARACRFISPF